MLSELEHRTINLIWNYSCKLYTIPLTWKNSKLRLSRPKKYSSLSTVSIWFVIMALFAWKLTQFTVVIGRGNVNGSILIGIFTIFDSLHIIFKLNFALYKQEMLCIANQVLYCNSVWGKKAKNYSN